ncbi:MAG: molybdenum cofactor biosynthesis protein MoaE [Fidelibacterota bacterium]
MVIAEIVRGRIIPFPRDDSRKDEGAELIFNGCVRATEQGQPILALEYEQYEGMAEQELLKLAEEAVARFPIRDLFCRHRVGELRVGETAVHVIIWSRHRQEAFQALEWFMNKLKQQVPIWKWALLPDGSRIPSECRHN